VNTLIQQLKAHTTVVADTGELQAIRDFAPEDATTNPSLILKAASSADYAPLLAQLLEQAHNQAGEAEARARWAAEQLTVAIGTQILAWIPGRISTEVDARLSFDTLATLTTARRLIDLYAQAGVPKERVLIKIAATWEGIRAAEILEQEGVQCNLTLLFSFSQARACAEAGVYLISPFVGRILDWHQSRGAGPFSGENDPGVQSVSHIYRYFKQHGYPTVVMGASFRNLEQIRALTGCDRLTISPALLQQLGQQRGEWPRQLDYQGAILPRPALLGEAEFRWQLNQDAMATEKLAEGIRAFAADQDKLEQLFAAQLA